MSAPMSDCSTYECNSTVYSNIKTLAYFVLWGLAIAALLMEVL